MNRPTKTQSAVVLVQRDEQGRVTIRDANGNVRPCQTADDYRAAIVGVLDDPRLPPLEDVPPAQVKVEEVVVEYARELAPVGLRPFVAPALGHLRKALEKVSDAPRWDSRRGRKKKRAARARRPRGRGRAA